MSENIATVKAGVAKNSRFHKIWLVPIVTFVIGLWMVYANWASQGPLIEISLQSAEGIEAAKTKVKRKNVEIGEVLSLALSDDAQGVVLSVRIYKEYTELLRVDSNFWVVRPRVGRGGVSGLSTLLSGAYIEMSLGVADDSAREFDGLERPPVTPFGTPGLHVTLSSEGDRPLTEGQPVLFHGAAVGRIEYVHFNIGERRTYYNAFIKSPHDALITKNTRFWFSNGIAIDLSADGIRVEMATLETIVEGGVSFDVPQGQPLGEPVAERTSFQIYPNKNSIKETQYEHSLSFMLLFEDSVRGLRPGAPVEFRGIRVGEVLRTDIEYPEVDNLLDPTSRIPVLINIVPSRLGFDDTEEDAAIADARIEELIGDGLHGSLASGNLLTGRKFVELDYLPVATEERQAFGDYAVIPTVGGQISRVLDSVARTMDTLNNLPLNDLVDSARGALKQTTTTLAELDEILKDDASHEILLTLNKTLLSFRQLATDFSQGSETHRDLQRGLQSMERMLLELQPVLRELRKKPNSLIFGGESEVDVEPEGAQE
jgi:paraquat-inducible protein B